MEVARCRIKTGARWSIALALETVAASALVLVEEGSSGEVRRTLGSNRDVVRADDTPIEPMYERGYLWTWTSVLDERHELLGLAEEARLDLVCWELLE
jgi:hypothetical protein